MKKFSMPSSERAMRGPAAVEAEAAVWSDRLREEGDDADVRRAFERWRAEDPERAETFENVDRSYRTAREAVADSPLLQAMHERSRERVAGLRKRRRRRLVAAAASVVASVGLGLFVATGGEWRELQYMGERAGYALIGETLYRTGVGERLAVTLGDGTVLTLNTDSRVIVDYGDGVRHVRQARGQALFEVARDADRPFVVAAGSHRVTALGTAFDVRLTGDRFEVTLIEGQVRVEDNPSPQPSPRGGEGATPSENSPLPGEEGAGLSENSPLPLGGEGQGEGGSSRTTNNEQRTTVLQPGQRYIALAAATPAMPVIRPADIHRATSWRHGQLIFQNDPLAEAIAEFNRYNSRRIVLAGDDLADLPISGAFRTGNTAGFIATVNSYFGLYVAERTEDRIVLARRRG